MANIKFHKYHGTGNDFVIIDNRGGVFPKGNTDLIGQLCHRRFGIGADGVILIEDHDTSDFRMIYYNPDGSQSLCGNGSRCAVMFANALGIIDQKTDFVAFDGLHHAYIKNALVHLHMHDVTQIERDDNGFFVDTGSPHLIRQVKEIGALDVKKEGAKIRYSEPYKEDGVNINFIEKNQKSISIRTYERGVEDETYSCGTGCTAVALASSELGESSPVTLEARGGTLQVAFQKSETGYNNIYLIGPAKEVYSGKIEI